MKYLPKNKINNKMEKIFISFSCNYICQNNGIIKNLIFWNIKTINHKVDESSMVEHMKNMLDKAVATKEGAYGTVKCGDYSVLTAGKTAVVNNACGIV